MNEERRKGDRRVSPGVSEFALQERGELLARIKELEADVLRWRANSAENKLIAESLNAELAALTGKLSAGVADEREEFEAWRVDNFYGGIERLNKCSNAPDVYYYTAEQEAWRVWQARARLNPCRKQPVLDGYVMVPIGLAHILMAPNARPLTARDARNALRAIVDSAAPSAQQEESDDE